jgi:hypothetical protein
MATEQVAKLRSVHLLLLCGLGLAQRLFSCPKERTQTALSALVELMLPEHSWSVVFRPWNFSFNAVKQTQIGPTAIR